MKEKSISWTTKHPLARTSNGEQTAAPEMEEGYCENDKEGYDDNDTWSELYLRAEFLGEPHQSTHTGRHGYLVILCHNALEWGRV